MNEPTPTNNQHPPTNQCCLCPFLAFWPNTEGRQCAIRQRRQPDPGPHIARVLKLQPRKNNKHCIRSNKLNSGTSERRQMMPNKTMVLPRFERWHTSCLMKGYPINFDNKSSLLHHPRHHGLRRRARSPRGRARRFARLSDESHGAQQHQRRVGATLQRRATARGPRAAVHRVAKPMAGAKLWGWGLDWG